MNAQKSVGLVRTAVSVGSCAIRWFREDANRKSVKKTEKNMIIK